MFFGSVSFAESPFADPGGVNILVTVSGQRINLAIGNASVRESVIVLPTGEQVNLATGNVVITIDQTVLITGNQINLATGTASMVSWTPIIPGATGVWNQMVPGATGIWIPIDPDNP